MPTLSPADSGEWTILRVLQWAAGYFKDHGIDSPRSTAEILLAHALQSERVGLYMHYDKPLTAAELEAFKGLLRRRLRREPVGYIVGRKGFWTLELDVGPQVLIPRPETESLVEAALQELKRQPPGAHARVLDLGTGSGAVVLALASEAGDHRYWACDVSPAAVALARRNAEACGLAGKVRLFVSDWLSALGLHTVGFDLIVSNPPYVAGASLPELQPEIVQFEPALALDGGPDGLRSYRAILSGAHRHLVPGGALVLEIGHDQGPAVERIAEAVGAYEGFGCSKDYGGHDRVFRMCKKIIATH
jgi:release factor glutamine methyltransferase